MTKLPHHSSTEDHAIITNGEAQVWNDATGAMTTFVNGDFSDYLLTPTRLGSSQLWHFTVPAGLPPGDYIATTYRGTTPAVGDAPSTVIAFGWDGVSLISDSRRTNPRPYIH
jgi:hypothetical protein